jgi:hypothetical protein
LPALHDASRDFLLNKRAPHTQAFIDNAPQQRQGGIFEKEHPIDLVYRILIIYVIIYKEVPCTIMAFVFASFSKGLFMKSIKMALLTGACLSLLGAGFAGQVRAEEGVGGREPSVIIKEIEQKKEELKALHQELKSVRGERRDDRMEKMKEKHPNMSEKEIRDRMEDRRDERVDRGPRDRAEDIRDHRGRRGPAAGGSGHDGMGGDETGGD